MAHFFSVLRSARFQSFHSLRYAAAVGAITLALVLPLIVFGLDFTDAAYSTTIAWTQATMPHAADWTINTFGTPLLVGQWFSITGWHSLLGFRVLWALTMMVAALAVYAAIRPFYEQTHKPLHIVLAIAPTVILAVFNSEEVIVPEYHNFPPVLCVISAAAFVRAFRENTSSVRLYALASGFVAACAVFARLPMLAFFVFMLGCAVWQVWAVRKVGEVAQRTRALQRASFLVLGFALGGALMLALLMGSGFSTERVWAETVASQRANTEFMRTVNPALGYMPLGKSTAIRYAKICGMGALLLAGCAAWALLWRWLRNKVGLFASNTRLPRFAEAALVLVFASVVVKIVLSGAAGFLGFHYGPITSLLLGTPLLAVAAMLVVDYRAEQPPIPLERSVLLLTALALFVVASLGGSGVWVSTFRHGVWLLLPVVLLERSAVLERFVDMRLLRILLVAGVIALGFTLRVQMPYRDKPVRELTATVRHPALAGIRTSAARAVNLEEALQAAQMLGVREGDTLQCYPDGALVYFLTKTVPWHEDTWIGMQWTVRDDLARKAQHSMERSTQHSTPAGFPKFVVRLKFDPNSAPSLDADVPAVRYTPNAQGLYFGFLSQPASHYLDSLWQQRGYTLAWENKGFAILKRP